MRSAARVMPVSGALTLVALGAAACGTGGGSHPAAAPSRGGSGAAGPVLRAAYMATTRAPTASFRFTESIQAGGSPEPVTLSGSGQADFAARAFAARLAVPNAGTVQVLLTRGTEYLQVPPAVRGQIPGHKAWLSVNLNRVSEAQLGQSLAQLGMAGNGDPTQALAQLSAVSGNVTRIGPATAAGVPTTEYRAQISLDRVAARDQAAGGTRAAQAIRQEIKALGTAALPADVWVDAHHLVRQIRYQVPVPATRASGGRRGHAVLTMTYTGFGAPLHLRPPAPGQTADITSQVLQHSPASPG